MKYVKKNLRFLWVIMILNIACIGLVQAATKFVVLQTTFTLNNEDDSQALNASDFFCSYCGHLLENASRDVQQRQVCLPCGKTMVECLKGGVDHIGQPELQGNFPEAKSHGINIQEIARSLKASVENNPVGNHEVYPDSKLQSQVATLSAFQVDCEDCGTQIPFSNIIQHATGHQFTCPLCESFEPEGNFQQRQDQMTWHAKTCEKPCTHCHTPYTAERLSHHETICSQQPVSCQHCHEQVLLGNYAAHCIQGISQGAHDHVGCPVCEQVVSSLDYPQHFEALHRENNYQCHACSENHLDGQGLFYHVTEKHPEVVMQVLAPDTSFENDEGQANNRQLLHIIKVYRLASPQDKGKSKLENLAATLKKLSLEQASCHQQVTELKEKVGNARNGYKESDVLWVKQQELERTQEKFKVSISELDLQIQCALIASYDGTFLWRVPDYEQRKSQADDQTVTSIYSPPFYTGKNGYKMCVRLYPNGDGSGYGTHLSVFIVIMKGEYDNLLKWPFVHRVSFVLCDQSGNNEHLCQTFKPAYGSNCFQKPKEEMNIATGCPKFCEQELLVSTQESALKEGDCSACYLCGGALYLKCIVDTTYIRHP